MSLEELRRSLTAPVQWPNIPDVKPIDSVLPASPVQVRLSGEGIRHFHLPLWNQCPNLQSLMQLSIHGEGKSLLRTIPKNLLLPRSCTKLPFWLFRTLPTGKYHGFFELFLQKKRLVIPYDIEIEPRLFYPLWDIWPSYLYHNGSYFLSSPEEKCESLWFLSNATKPITLSLKTKQTTSEQHDWILKQETVTLQPSLPTSITLTSLFQHKQAQHPLASSSFVVQLDLLEPDPSTAGIQNEFSHRLESPLVTEGSKCLHFFFADPSVSL